MIYKFSNALISILPSKSEMAIGYQNVILITLKTQEQTLCINYFVRYALPNPLPIKYIFYI